MNRQESYRKKSWLNVLVTSSHLCFLLFSLLCAINGMPSHTAKQTEINEWLKAVTVFVFASPPPLVIGKAWGGQWIFTEGEQLWGCVLTRVAEHVCMHRWEIPLCILFHFMPMCTVNVKLSFKQMFISLRFWVIRLVSLLLPGSLFQRVFDSGLTSMWVRLLGEAMSLEVAGTEKGV